MSRQNQKLNLYAVEEFHRGKWIPLKATDKDGKETDKKVKITAEIADVMNIDAESDMKRTKKTNHFRYVLVSEESKLPSYTEQKAILKEAGVEFKSNAKKADLEIIYLDYVKSQEGDK